MKYREFSIKTTAEAEDIVADIFLRYTDEGVSVASKEEVLKLVSDRRDTFDYIDEDLLIFDDVSVVKGCFPIETAAEDFLKVEKDLENAKKSAEGYIDFGSLETSFRDFDSDEWIDSWRKHFKPIETEKLCIKPSWVDYGGKKPQVVIGTDLAFGTGEHETTIMCVRFLERYVEKGSVVIDVGTGSGILGIAAAKLGAKKVFMTDNDPVAVKAAKNNVKLNGDSAVCSAMKDTEAYYINEECDLAVANITAEILEKISGEICGYLKKKSVLILSGILNDRVSVPVNAFERFGFFVCDRSSLGEWTALVLKRN